MAHAVAVLVALDSTVWRQVQDIVAQALTEDGTEQEFMAAAIAAAAEAALAPPEPPGGS